MVKVTKEITLKAGDFKSIKLGVTEAVDFNEADKILKEELDKMPEIRKLNEEDLKKVNLW